MADRLTLDVINRPASGVLRSLRRVSAIRAARPAGMRALLALGTASFVPRVRPAPTPRRIAVLAAWEAGDDIDAAWAAALGDLCEGAREHWHVEAELVRAAFTGSWKGWTPDAAGARALEPDEPALVLISGNLRARYVPAFARDAAGAVAHAFAHPGYLGGLAINSSPLNTTSCSCWRTYRDARDYAFKPGGHLAAIQRDRARHHHKTEYFLRLRPVVERGRLAGATPLRSVLGQDERAAVGAQPALGSPVARAVALEQRPEAR
jgi:hypothetical protein